jgi:hypothetical protein
VTRTQLRQLLLAILVVSSLVMPVTKALADGPVCKYEPDGSITCTDGGGGGNDGGGGNGSNPTPVPVACTPGETMKVQRFEPQADGTCMMYIAIVDQCSGQMVDFGSDNFEETACPEVPDPPPSHPCTTFSVTSGGITCDANHGWHVRANVRFPETYLDVRPFPVTLVRWPTALRNGGQPSASGSGTQGYYGSGSAGNPNVGDWSNIRLTLTLNPASPLFVTLPQLPALSLADGGATGNPTLVQWEVPSHPEAGGGPLARTVSGMDELPGDMPLFVGNARSAYRLFWNLSYFEYEAIEECVSGPNGNGNYNCGGGTGHKEVAGYEWRRHSSGGEIPPSAVANLPASVAADLNGDGMAEAYWDRNLTLRRMDNAGSVDNPTYRRSWNWGGLIYWAVREGQGQIGWPGGQ